MGHDNKCHQQITLALGPLQRSCLPQEGCKAGWKVTGITNSLTVQAPCSIWTCPSASLRRLLLQIQQDVFYHHHTSADFSGVIWDWGWLKTGRGLLHCCTVFTNEVNPGESHYLSLILIQIYSSLKAGGADRDNVQRLWQHSLHLLAGCYRASVGRIISISVTARFWPYNVHLNAVVWLMLTLYYALERLQLGCKTSILFPLFFTCKMFI